MKNPTNRRDVSNLLNLSWINASLSRRTLGALILSLVLPIHAVALDFPLLGESGERIFGYGSISTFALAPEGNMLAIGNSLGLFLWDISTENTALKNFKQNAPLGEMMFLNDVELGILDDAFTRFDTDTLTARNLENQKYPARVLSSNGQYLTELSENASTITNTIGVVVQNIDSGTIVYEATLEKPTRSVHCAKLSSNGRYFFVSFAAKPEYLPRMY